MDENDIEIGFDFQNGVDEEGVFSNILREYSDVLKDYFLAVFPEEQIDSL